jgi:hypothetical protein
MNLRTAFGAAARPGAPGLAKLAAFALALVVGAPAAHAFCGFYVNGSGEHLFADATQVVLMRNGTRTILTMQNDYKGPAADFAMVVPVPVVLKKEDVHLVSSDVFERVESQGSPRLVEYWEQDPCPDLSGWGTIGFGSYGTIGYGSGMGMGYGGVASHGVTVEAEFDVGEYHIQILSAKESTGLQTWLGEKGYKIPKNAEPLLRPYVEAGSKFFVAKVDPDKVTMENGHVALSPLRFDYESEEFSLPIRLGLANSEGKQDLIVNIIAPDKRYEVANYKNVFIPTNVDVKDGVKTRFAEFYASLFDATIAANPGAVVTEYAWTSKGGNAQCDPCPDSQMTSADLDELGGDVVDGIASSWVLTRLHTRYSAKDMKDDLRFKEAKAVTGGREEWSKKGLEYGAHDSTENFFQARFAVRHWWTGPIKCKNPQRGVWGGPPDGGDQSATLTAQNLAFTPRGKIALGSMITRDLWEIGFKKAAPAKAKSSPAKTMGLGLAGLLVLLLGFLRWRRRT